MIEKTTAQQVTEGGPYPWKPERCQTVCFVCKQSFKEGDVIFIAKGNRHISRHTTCARNPATRRSAHEPYTEEAFLQKQREERMPEGTGKRQRTGGHGYSGGDGFKNL